MDSSQIDASAKVIFSKYDKDGSGFIEVSELIMMIKETYKMINPSFDKVITKEELDKTLDLYDKNKDGRISYEEYRKVVGRAFGEK